VHADWLIEAARLLSEPVQPSYRTPAGQQPTFTTPTTAAGLKDPEPRRNLRKKYGTNLVDAYVAKAHALVCLRKQAEARTLLEHAESQLGDVPGAKDTFKAELARLGKD
jgi:hypothetical protein